MKHLNIKMGQAGEQDNSDIASNLENKNDGNIQNGESKKKYKCNYLDCNAMFLRPSRLERHMRSHTGEVTIIKVVLLHDISMFND